MSKPTLTAGDWMEIYYALDSKLKSPTLAGDDEDSVDWRNHLQEIMDKIGEDGINMLAPDGTVAIHWSFEDVQSVREDLSDDNAMDVLLSAVRGHDASIGINWDVLEAVADSMFPRAAR